MKISGKVTGYFFFGSSLGGMLIPMVLGQIFEYIGSYQIMLALFVLTIAGLVVLISVIFASNRAGEKVRT
jgi:MFS transporter, FHS family, Na+ dependent glucose transporter 1